MYYLIKFFLLMVYFNEFFINGLGRVEWFYREVIISKEI